MNGYLMVGQKEEKLIFKIEMHIWSEWRRHRSAKARYKHRQFESVNVLK